MDMSFETYWQLNLMFVWAEMIPGPLLDGLTS